MVFEAKETDTDRITYDRLTDKQIEALEAHHNLGAAAFVLVSFGLQDFYRVPWETWRSMKELYGRKYIRQDELEEYRVQYLNGVIKMLEGIEIVYGEEDE